MIPRKQKEAILRSYYRSRDVLEKVAQEVMRLFDADIDPSVPMQSIYTIKYRIKDVERMLEKLGQKGSKAKITVDNFAKKVPDILGLRIVCLRLSDVEKVERFLGSLRKEEKLVFVKGPVKKQTFVLPVNPGEGVPKDIDLQYSGYSSIHYVIKLGKALRPTGELKSVLAELQVRTILEEAWGEIDHKYRYEIARREGKGLPDHVTRGFYNFSAYLQAAALQAEYLCKEVESISAQKRPPRRRGKGAAPTRPPSPETGSSTAEAVPADRREAEALTVEVVLQDKTGCPPTERLAAYVKSRLWNYGLGYVGREKVLSDRILSEQVMSKFRQIYTAHAHRKPFQESSCDIDVINLVNFGLAHLNQSASSAEQGLIAILNKRFA